MACLRLWIKGQVQGVGFRPFVFNLASSLSLKGFVKNSSKGVLIEIEGERVDEFLYTLKTSPPPLARIDTVEIQNLPPKGYDKFLILESTDEGSFTHISPDVSICQDCLAELLDPKDRRYLYPFINCTNCGPRYSITLRLPYDRPNTTMKAFQMCRSCSSEYHDPLNRRFHAQPNACAECGPSVQLKLLNEQFKSYLISDEPIINTISLLQQGAIVAIKGLGGFHLACNGLHSETVRLLRQRKKRGNKPFALMAPDIETIEQFCYITSEEKELLLSSKRPIVLLRKRPHCSLPEEIAPDNAYLGFMLPYTPLHYLLFFHPAANNKLKVLVMTSGNLSEEPIVHTNPEAEKKLTPLVDAFLFHNRDIFMRVDDSVITKDFFIRRARGYVPEPVKLPFKTAEAVAVGADLKNTFTLTKEGFAIMSQHIGDMENYESQKFFIEVFDNLSALYRVEPKRVAADMHPEYHTSRIAESFGLPVWRFQHHEAHAAAVMAEAGITEPVLAVVFDGTGYGTDGTIWGSEFLLITREGLERLAHFKPIKLVGADMAIKEPWRQALSVIKDSFADRTLEILDKLGFTKRLPEEKLSFIYKALSQPFGVASSGAGRIFDAVASIVGLKDFNTFEAEAPIALESVLIPSLKEYYEFNIIAEKDKLLLDWRQMIVQIVEDKLKAVPVSVISTKFHNTLAKTTVKVIDNLYKLTGIRKLVISGGVFQNRFLLKRLLEELKATSLDVFFHKNFPPNDACISLGQAFLLWWRYPDE